MARNAALFKGGPLRQLRRGIKRTGGRNNLGRITAFHRGGGTKRLLRTIDTKRNVPGMVGTVERIEYDPFRTARTALIRWEEQAGRDVVEGKPTGEREDGEMTARSPRELHLPRGINAVSRSELRSAVATICGVPLVEGARKRNQVTVTVDGRRKFSTTSGALEMPFFQEAQTLSKIGSGRVFGSSYRYLSASTTSSEPAAETSAGSSKNGDGTQGSKTADPSGKPVREGPVTWLSLLLLMMTGGGLIIYYDKEKKHQIEELKTGLSTPKQGPSVGAAAIGGPFKLVNHEGKPVSEKDFLGKWTLIYFGFTHCPDICPDELIKLSAAIDKIKEKAGEEIVPVFISVDPERDTVEQVRDYVQEFHPKLIGLTGSPEDIKQVARAYRVYYMKTEQDDSDYLVDHSIIMYLMNPKMEFTKFFGKNYDVDSLADGIIKELKQYKE